MKNLIIFSGTTEGRRLSEWLSEDKIRHIVCVAGDYGKEMMNENPFLDIHIGRMDKDSMIAFFEEKQKKDNLIVDATHPYATEVTKNLREAAAAAGYGYLRVVREKSDIHSEKVTEYHDISECASVLDKAEGNILLTTGSKELNCYCGSVSEKTKKRTYVRVLPSIESLNICHEEGIEQDHIIAMHGPFSYEMNKALIRQYDIRHLVTKDGGMSGGFDEKLRAALNSGVEVHVITRPTSEEGVSVEEAYKKISGHRLKKQKKEMQIYLAGTGMGENGCITEEVRSAIAGADIIFGAKRLLQNIVHPHKYEMYLAKDIIPVLEKEKTEKACVVFSGDTGFYSGAGNLRTALKEWRKELNIIMLPGISSFSYLAAKLGESYEDAVLFSLHGKNTENDIADLISKVKNNRKVFVLLSTAADIPVIADCLIRAGVDAKLSIGRNLSYGNETISVAAPEELLSYEGGGIITLMIKNEEPLQRRLTPFLKDSFFQRGKVPMTKECVRHESIIRLDLKAGDLLYDIGGGTGSVAIEAASLSPEIKVVTIEKKKEAAELIKENIERAGAGNVEIIEGNAEEVLPSMEKPDCVFIGGSGGKLKEIISILHKKGRGIRYVINAVSMETIGEVSRLTDKYKVADSEVICMSVTEAKEAGSCHLMSAQNPVWIFSFTL